MRNIQYLTIDINKKTQRDVTANEGEIGSRFLKIKITDDNVPIDLTGTKVYLYALKSDNTKLFNLAEIENATQGVVLAELTSQLLISSGVVKLTIVITEGSNKLISKEFSLKVDDSIFDDDAIVSTNEFTALTTALGQVQNIDNRFNEVNEQFISKANDSEVVKKGYGTLSDFNEETRRVLQGLETGQINAVLGDGNVTLNNLSNEITVTIKGNNLFTGTQNLMINGVEKKCTNFIDLSSITQNSLVTNLNTFIHFALFDENNTFIKTANTTANGIIPVIKSNQKLVIYEQTNGFDSISYIINSNNREDLVLDVKYLNENLFFDLNGSKLKNNSVSMEKLDSSFTEIEKGTNLYKFEEHLKNYTIKDSSGATIATNNFTNWIEVTEGIKYASSLYYTQFYFFDANKVYLSQATILSNPAVFTTPSNAKYVLIRGNADENIKVCEGTSISNVTNDKVVINSELLPSTIGGYQSRWKGKKWIIIGDSISTEKGSYAQTGYGTIVSSDLGFSSVTNLAVSGRTMSDAIGWIDTQVPTEYDLITVMMGTNDMGYNTAIGTIEDTPSQNGTFYARCKMMIEKLLTKNLNAKIVFLTPIRRADGEGLTNFNTNALGKTTKDYVDVVKDVCNFYGIDCLDLYSNGINPRLQDIRTKYFVSATDGTHPNSLGHAKYIAPKVRDFLEKIAPYELT